MGTLFYEAFLLDKRNSISFRLLLIWLYLTACIAFFRGLLMFFQVV